jgi:hypothetical protein
MKFTNLAFAVALACGLVATSTQAQDGLREAALTYNYYAQEGAAASPSDLAAVETTTSDLTFVGSDKSGKDNGGSKGGKGGKGGKSGKGRARSWILDSYIAAGATFNADHPRSKYNGPVTFNDRDREFQMNQAYLSLGREVDNSGCGWGLGGQIDLLYGTDYIFTQAVGLETKDDGQNAWNGSKMYGLAMPQAFVDVKYNDLNVRLGHFYTIMGYEVVKATGNFFYSHAYTMQYGEPFTHTGALASWERNDWTLYGGVVNGWDKFDAVSDKLAFLGGATWDPCGRDYSLTGTIISGEEDGALVPGANPTSRTGYSIVFDWDISCRLKYVFQHDNFWQDNANPINPALDAEWYGINQYLLYTVNDCWALGARFEWFRDDDGVRLNGAALRETATGRPAITPIPGVVPAPGVHAGNYYAFTLGANWTPRERITVRPEARWDWSDGTTAAIFGDGMKDSQFTAAIDAIVTF